MFSIQRTLVVALVCLSAGRVVWAQGAAVEGARAGRRTYNRVAMYILRKEYGQAKALTEAALRENPDHPSFRELLGVALHARGDVSGAIREFSHAIREYPLEPSFYCNRGRAY